MVIKVVVKIAADEYELGMFAITDLDDIVGMIDACELFDSDIDKWWIGDTYFQAVNDGGNRHVYFVIEMVPAGGD